MNYTKPGFSTDSLSNQFLWFPAEKKKHAGNLLFQLSDKVSIGRLCALLSVVWNYTNMSSHECFQL